MSKEAVVLMIGVVVFFTPFLGVPNDWKRYLLAGAGFLIAILGYQLRRAAYLRSIDNGNGEKHAESFVEGTVPSTAEKLESTTTL